MSEVTASVQREVPPVLHHRAEALSRGRRWLRSLAQIPDPAWMVIDIALTVLACQLALQWVSAETNAAKFGAGAWAMGAVAGVVFVLAGIAMNFYYRGSLRGWVHCMTRVAACGMFATAGFVATGYFLFYAVPGRWVTVGFLVLLVVFAASLRVPFLLLRNFLRTRVLFIGSKQEVQHLEEVLERAGPHSYELVEFWDVNTSKRNLNEQSQALLFVCGARQIDEIVLSSSREEVGRWFEIVLTGIRLGCRLRVLPDLIEDERKEVPVDLVDPVWLLGGDLDLRNQFGEVCKRGLDILVSLVGLVICAPIFLLLAILIKVTSKGPIFYSQVRVGRFGKHFNILKFRTMRVDAEKHGAQWAQTNDPRVTWYGGYLRKSRLDETPQFINILLGHMSFVGPRPERPEFVEELDEQIPYYGCRHLVRPGLTGWAQICYRYGASVDDAKHKLQYDLYYVRHQSLSFDLFIVLRTFLAIAKGAR